MYLLNMVLPYMKSRNGDDMQISARNQLKGKITDVDVGAVMANIKIEITEPDVITAVITKESVEKLGLTEGDEVCALIKSTEVIVGK